MFFRFHEGLRLFVYWLTVAAFLLACMWYSLQATPNLWEPFVGATGRAFIGSLEVEYGRVGRVVLLGSMVSVATVAGALLITSAPLPTWRTVWVNKIISYVRGYRVTAAEDGKSIAMKNQFMLGTAELNFNYVAILVVVIPTTINYIIYMAQTDAYYPKDAEDSMKDRFEWTGVMFGWAGILALAFFLIPVTRHSILLVAMGWSPVHALRIHIVAGWFAFWLIILHSLVFVIDWFVFYDSVVEAIWPPPGCWKWSNPTVDNPYLPTDDANALYFHCGFQFFNFTGIFATLFILPLGFASMGWFRRKNYRLFYLIHVIFGTATLIAIIIHWPGGTTILWPSFVYYLASTSPTLIQALASRFRGGHKIVRVISLGKEGGDCMEVHVASDPVADSVLNKEASMFVKLCVPSISVIWHPFTVFKHPRDPSTVRFLFRPIGRFTNQLATELLKSPRPTTVLDGYYSVGDRARDALQHDHVTIVAGGVAITPFLSLIQNLLRLLHMSRVDMVDLGLVNTQKIILHWVCREKGLILYLFQNYLSSSMAVAEKLGLMFEIHIHCTDPKVEGPLVVPIQLLPEEALCAAVEDLEKESEQQGFAFELARMMPGRYCAVWQNLPLFFAILAMVWFGMWDFFHFDVIQEEAMNYNPYLGSWIGTVTWIFVSFVFGIIIEGSVLAFRSYWPAPQPNDFEVIPPHKVFTNDFEAIKAEGLNEDVRLVEHFGRPDPLTLLDDARNAEAPCVFLCGPAPLVDGVADEAKKENKLGWRRFVVYEEPFDM
ncbi:ferric reductase like transmembrane component [Nitzschia inconspicua]|uniref:Ferric reductase like transmembrane component n=1 Tax=Nitzschia inconspicua TaxID=303405 RepID=A0A9K3Q1L1_9STRA|nr:ferric reductase like transmembrane component [Nitzschia inconspicua]